MMRNRILHVVLLGCLLSAIAASAADIVLSPCPTGEWEEVKAAVRPRAAVVRVVGAPVIDGALDDATWGKTERIETAAEQIGVPQEASGWMKVRLGYTDQALYIAAELTRPGPVLHAKVDRNYDRVWLDDAFEFFLFSQDTRVRYQVDFNARGVYWAGADKAGMNWKPDIRCAAKTTPDGYTLEAEILWSQLGVEKPESASFAVQWRYLVNEQSGSVAWSAGNTPAEYGILDLVADASRVGQYARVKRMLFPKALPAGVNRVGLEVENPSDRPRKVVVRLYHYEPRQAEATEYVDVPPGATKQVLLPLKVPEQGEAHRLLVFQDMAAKQLQFVEERRVRALPPLRFSLARERFWFGDKAADGSIEIGLDDKAREAATLRVELWGRKSLLAEKVVSPIASCLYRIRVGLEGLPPEPYRLFIAVGDGTAKRDLVTEMNVEQAAPLPERRRVALRIDWPDGIVPAEAAPLYAGVSFPGGMLLDPQNVRLVDDKGVEVPCQTEVLARWSPEGSTRWLGLYFSGKRGSEYSVEFGSRVKRAPAAGVTVRDDPGALVVGTGVARFELPKRGPLFGAAWIGDRQVLKGGAPCLILADQNKRLADETRGPADEAPAVEVNGPQRVIVRREGLYRTADGQRLAKYIVRLTFAAGSSVVPIQHSLILTEDTNQVSFSDVAVRVKPAFEGPWTVQLDNSPAYDAKTFSTTLDPGRGDAAYLLQAVYKHHFQPQSRYEIGLRSGRGEWQVKDRGEVAGQWASASAGGLGAAITIRNLPQLFPKEIEVGPDGLTAHLWSSRGGRLLDYRASTLIEYWGVEWFKKYSGGLDAARAIRSNAAGTARTHDLSLHLFAGLEPERVASYAHIADQPVLAIQDPTWLNETDAIGRVHPYDPKRFPEVERFNEQFFRECFVKAADEVGDYGYFDYGSGPHCYPNCAPGKGYPRFYRYSTIEYMGRTAFWLAYARSGDRVYRDYADAFSRNISDYRFSYWPLRDRPLGAMLGGGVSYDTPFYWTGVPQFFGAQGDEIRHFRYQYYLTGDRWAIEGTKLWSDWMARRFDPVIGKKIAGSMHEAYWMLAQQYFETWDERIGDLVPRTRDEYLDLRTTTGLFDIDYYGATYKYHVEVFGALCDWLATGAATPRDAFLKSADWMLHSIPGYETGYQDHGGIYMNYAGRATRDPRYAAWIAERLGRMAHRYIDEKGNFKFGAGYAAAYTGAWNSNIFETIAYGLDAVARAGKDVRPWPASETSDKFLILKEPHEPVTLDLTFGPTMDLQLVRLLNEKDSIRRDYFVGPVTTDLKRDYFTKAAPGLGGGYGRLTLPVEGLPGEYRLTDATILWTDARKLVSVVPEGAFLNAVSAKPRAWFFQVPRGKNGSVCANRQIVLRSGADVLQVPAGRWLELKGGAQDALYAIEASDRTFVRFAGDIPPILAESDAGRFFVPKSAPPAAPIGILEDPKALYVAGVTNGEGDKAILLNGNRTLTLPMGKELDPTGVYDHFNNLRGTLEFWFKPQWTSRLLTKDERRPIVEPCAWQLFFVNFMEEGLRGHERSGIHYMTAPQQGTGINAHSGHNFGPLEQGVWHHLAICWDTLPKRGWVSQLYVNGRPGEPANPGEFRLARFAELEDKVTWRAANVVPRFPLRLSGAFDAVIDEVRISDVVRYPRDFTPSPPGLFGLDEHTLLLMRLNGDQKVLRGQTQPEDAR